jgi:hypothetical protein
VPFRLTLVFETKAVWLWVQRGAAKQYFVLLHVEQTAFNIWRIQKHAVQKARRVTLYFTLLFDTKVDILSREDASSYVAVHRRRCVLSQA